MADRFISERALYKAIEDFFDGVCVYDVTPSEAISDFESIVDSMPKVVIKGNGVCAFRKGINPLNDD